MSTFLEMRDITKRFGDATVLKRVSIDVRRGEMLGLVGENGAGKSTLMSILSGSWPAGTFEGEIRIEGAPRRFAGPADADAAGIAMIYQEARLIPELSVAENILLGRLPKRGPGIVDWPAAHRRAAELLERLDLAMDTRQPTLRLGPSQQQVVAIAKALAQDSRLLILDEPTATLTEREARTLFRIIRGLRDSGTSIIYISHRLEEILEMADRVTVLRDGALVETRANDADLSVDELIRQMVGRPLADIYQRRAPAPGSVALEVRNLSLPHPFLAGRRLLDDVSFSVRRGEILGIGGLVGAGRTEVLTAIFGLQGAGGASGRILVHGAPATIRSPADAKRHRIALLTENRRTNGLVMSFPIGQNITLASFAKISRNGLISRSSERRLGRRQVEALNVRPRDISALALNLSGGNQQKVILGKWLLTEADILLLDEPTQGIDVGAKAEIYRLMEELTGRGLAIVWVSSELPELLAMSDRIIVLAAGRVRGELDRSAATPERVMALATDFSAAG